MLQIKSKLHIRYRK